MPYIGKSPTGTGVRSRYYFTATAGATSLSGADDNSNTLVFSDGNYVDVSLNGIALVAGTDYNTSTANTISGLSALSSGDIVEVVVYDIFTVADTVSAKDGGTFSGNVAVNGTMTATSFSGDGSALTGLGGSNVKEVLAMLCDGENYTVSSGTYTSTDVSAAQLLSTSFADVNGSSVSYTPPSATTAVIYEFNFSALGPGSENGIGSFKLFIDSDEVTDARTVIASASALNDVISYKYVIPVGGTADTDTGRQATWTSAKTLKLSARDYGSSNDLELFTSRYWEASSSAQFRRPNIIITALG